MPKTGRSFKATAGASIVALTGLLSTYATAVRATGTYASLDCNAVITQSNLVDAINAVVAGTCTTVNITADIRVTGTLPAVDISDSVAQAITFTTTNSSSVSGTGFNKLFSFSLDPADTLTVSNLEIYGGYAKGAVAAVYVNSGTVNLTDLDVHNNRVSGSYLGGVVALKETAAVTISGSTFSNNVATSSGAAVYIDSAGYAVTITESIFANNTSGENGGAVYISGTSGVTVTDSSFTGNAAADNTGGLNAFTPYLLIDGSYFANNQDKYGGSAVYVTYSGVNAVIRDSRFYSNTSELRKGSVWIKGNAEVSGSTFIGNTTGGFGGALYVDDDLAIDGSLFEDNSAGYGGAVSNDESGDVSVSDSTFQGNTAVNDAGAFYLNTPTSLTITDSTFEENIAGSTGALGSGGALYAWNAVETSITGSTFTDNSADYGGALYVITSVADIGAPSMYIGDSLITGNTATTGAGGGMGGPDNAFNVGATVRMIGTTVSDNTAAGDGGGIYAYSVVLDRSSVYGNTAASAGGGVIADQVTMTNSTVAYNTATGEVGGVYGGKVAAYFSTIAFNTATGGAPTDLYASYSLKLVATVVAGTGPGDSCETNAPLTPTLRFAVSTDAGCVTNGTNNSVVTTLTNIALGEMGAGGANGSQSMVPASTGVLATQAPNSALGTGIAVDQVGDPRTGSWPWTIGARIAQRLAQAPVLTADNPPGTGTAGTAYAGYTFAATGFPAPTFAVQTGSLPPGLTLNPTTGALSGTPTTGGAYTFTVRASNTGGNADSPSRTITIDQAPAFTADLPPASSIVNAGYAGYTFAATGYPAPTFAVQTGALPPGLSLNPTTGALTGTPTATGIYTFRIRASNSAGNVDSPVRTIEVTQPPAFTTDSPPSTGTVGVTYPDFTFGTTGFPTPIFEVNSGSLPPGLTLNRFSGLLSGTPIAAGAYTFSVRISNTAGSADSAVRTITIAGTPAPPGPGPAPGPGPVAAVPGAPSTPAAVAGRGSATVAWQPPASSGGSPITQYSVAASPGGASCSTSGATTCVVTGLTNGVRYTFTVTATNAAGTGPASGPSNAVIPVADADPLGPQPPVVTPAIPAGGLPPGDSLLLVNGLPTPVTVEPNAQGNPTGLRVSGDGWRMRLEGRAENGDPLGLTANDALILESDGIGRTADRAERARANTPVAQASGGGFLPNSRVEFYLLNKNTYLGFLSTDASGAFKGNVPVPPGLKQGSTTLQVNGLSPSGAVRSLSLGVRIKSSKVKQKVARTALRVVFKPSSANLTASARAALDALVVQTGRAGVRVRVVGLVSPKGMAASDTQLSTVRARNVAAYLRSQGLGGAYVVRGGVDSAKGARKVRIRVVYQPR